jgi:hypothetical protein
MSLGITAPRGPEPASPAPEASNLFVPPPSGQDEHVTLVAVARVASGLVVAADSRSTTSIGKTTWCFDQERKIFAMPDAPLVVAVYGTTRVGTEDVSALIRCVASDAPASTQSPSELACALEAELASRRAGMLGFGLSAVVAGYESDVSALWLVACRPSGVERSEIFPGGAPGIWWGGTTDALDRLLNGRDARLAERIEAWASKLADRTLIDSERSDLEAVLASVAHKVPWDALPLADAARVVRQLVETGVTYHALEGQSGPVGGQVTVASIDAWSRTVTVESQSGSGTW